MATVAAAITAYNRADYVTKCIQSLLDSEKEGAIELTLILLDNGSTDGTADKVRAMSDRVRIIRNEQNMPFPPTLNRALGAALEARTDFVILMNDDTSLLPDCLPRLIEAARERPKALFTPLQLNYRVPEHIDNNALASIRACRDLVEDAILERPLRPVYELPTIIGAGLFARREVYEEIGEFDTLFLFYGIDDDYCKRARALGFGLLLVPEAQMYHAHGLLVDEIKEDKDAWWRRWRSGLQARFMFILKEPSRPMWLNYVRAAGFALMYSMQDLSKLWLKGAAETLRIYLRLLMQYRKVRDARTRHFRLAGARDEPKGGAVGA
ncbi:MAG: glycosyltransferase family 2 protein [Candidatus Hydrogenedentes bacterium]|nr:glycosyltransferase family 2 protein [Candidatus Hydrogenedentota bacterium]